MHHKHKLTKNQGFTIIETMIVLAIAALILLIVFLAVPALQRSARNTSRKNDAGNIAAAINTWADNNNGTLPGLDQANTCQNDLNSAIKGINLGYYLPANVYCAANSTPNTTASIPNVCKGVGTSGCNSSSSELNTEDVIYLPGYSCSGNTPQAGATRGFAILYEIEASSSVSSEQCIGS
jgi:prepilin-type N-terminal cleavage/methylation domain-containing protein